ncbi:MAG: hypothetical protein ACLQBJ_18355 [Bryobacteraceae bacterium]
MKLWNQWVKDASVGYRASLRPEWTFAQRFARAIALVFCVDLVFFGGWHGLGAQALSHLPVIAVFSAIVSGIEHFEAGRIKKREAEERDTKDAGNGTT